MPPQFECLASGLLHLGFILSIELERSGCKPYRDGYARKGLVCCRCAFIADSMLLISSWFLRELHDGQSVLPLVSMS